MANILVVDDDEQICSVFERFLSEEKHVPRIASNAEDALKEIVEFRPDLVLMDVRMPGTDGLEALARVREVDPDVYVVIMTAYGTSQTSIEAMRLGAFDYLLKPLDLDVVGQVIDRALESKALGREVDAEPAEDYSLVNLVGNSPEMQQAYKLIGLLAANDVPALLVGERGVGKHLVAKTIHFNSPSKEGPFVTVDCRSLVDHPIEAELFGRDGEADVVNGTPAAPGKLLTATGGTVFLDNVDKLPLPVQSTLVAQWADRSFAGVDATDRGEAPGRILAASETDLAEGVRGGTFDEELLRILGTITIRLPPLRRRTGDIPDLASFFVARCNAELGKTLKGIDRRVTQLFLGYSWPGNVSELESVVKRAAILARGEVITPAEVEGSLTEPRFVRSDETRSALELAVRTTLRQRLDDEQASPDASSFHQIVADVEQILVAEALDMTSGNQLKAAELLGLNRATLRKKMPR